MAVMNMSREALKQSRTTGDGTLAQQPQRRALTLCSSPLKAFGLLQTILLFALVVFAPLSEAAFINFTDCLSEGILDSNNPQILQFVPLFFDVHFNETDPKHNLNITIYGNVTGQATTGPYPPPNDPSWNDPTSSFGKIVNATVNYTTLFAEYDVLTYTAYSAPAAQFCPSVINESCPLGPLFFANASDPYALHAFTLAHNFYSSYSFATIVPTIQIRSGDRSAPFIACISANVTPSLGSNLAAMLRYVPLAVLALVGIATIAAARFSPWSSKDFFYWTSNYGRDEDILRLVTPGFADCLQYIQFVVLAGSLSLSYPGYYQPVVSRASWSVLMFNESFVSHGPGRQSLVDGVYSVTSGAYGLTTLSQLVGMSSDTDIWAGMTIWLCVLVGALIVLSQLGFVISWVARMVSDNVQEDLRSKNLPFTGGVIVRLVYSYFLLPIISVTLFQLVIAGHSPSSVVAMSVVGLIAVLAFAAWIFYHIFTTRPRVHLFDHLPLLMFYGPLYNTYSDEAAPFAFIPVALTFMRGIAIGAIQPSGIAQLVILAICEVILILTLNAFRPFQSLTSMNAYHTFFSIVRLITVLLSIAFAPTLGVSEASKGWIGYAILLLHAIVLVFGFFLNAVQTLVEVFARMAGAGGRDTRGGLSKVFGVRQLSKRNRSRNTRTSLTSDQAMLARDSDLKSDRMDRAGSLSPSSAMILGQAGSGVDNRSSGGFDQISQGDVGSTVSAVSPGPSTPGGGAQSPFTMIGNSTKRTSTGGLTNKGLEPSDPYYRPPRPRRPTLEPLTSGETGLGVDTSPEQQFNQSPHNFRRDTQDSGFSQSRSSINATFLKQPDPEAGPADQRYRNATDFSKREADFYYGLRGPPLSSVPSRRLKTGPADPMSPVASATGWFRNFLGGKRNEKGKGFEVVRSTPLHLMQLEEEEEMAHMGHEPYRDSPERQNSPRRDSNIKAGASQDSPTKPSRSADAPIDPLSDAPPMLGPIETGGFDFPSRMNSRSSGTRLQPTRLPSLPRRSSKRVSTGPHTGADAYLPPQPASFQRTPHLSPSERANTRVPFGGSDRARRPSAASSIAAATPDDPSPLAAPPFAVPERPPSTGRVVQRRAADALREGGFSAREEAAEVVGSPPR